jgi:type IV pilus assembly protein PilE
VRQKGFTIVELIIVISVISILATIVIVSYSGTTNRANDSAVQHDLDAIGGQLEAYRVDPDNPSEFPHDATTLATLGIKATKNSYQTTIAANFIYCVSADFQSFTLVAKSKSNNFFTVTRDGLRPYTLTASDFTTAALCPGLGMTFIAAGMSAPNTWATWVGGN